MKKRVTIISIVFLLFLTACGNTSTENNITTTNVSTSTSKQEITAEQYYDYGISSFENEEYIDAIGYFQKCKSINDAEVKIAESQEAINSIQERATFAYNLQKNAIGYINDEYSFEVHGDLGEYKNVKDLKNLSRIEASFSYLVGITKDNKVKVFKTDDDDSFESSFIEKANDWTNIKQIEIEGRSIIGLKKDGTLIFSIDEENIGDYRQPEFEESYNWKDISFFKADYSYGIQAISKSQTPYATKYDDCLDADLKIVALDVGGFIVMVTPDAIITNGLLSKSINGVNESGIVDVAVGGDFAVFLYNTGKMVVWNTDNEIIEITETDNIVAVEASHAGTAFVAFRTDGTIHIFDYRSKIVSNDKIIVHKKHIYPGDNKSQQPIQETKKEPAIGMTKTEVLNSTWGAPKKKNITESFYGVREQWIYSNNRYIYFTDGIVTTIQRNE